MMFKGDWGCFPNKQICEDTPYAKCDSIIDNEIAAKLKKCNVTTLITVGKLIDVLIDQQEMIKKAELD